MKVADRASTRTSFRLGAGVVVEDVGLFKTTGDPDPARPEFVRFDPEETEKAADPLGGSKPSGGGGGRRRSGGGSAPKRPEKHYGVRKPDGSLVDVTEEVKRIEEETVLEAVEVLGFQSRAHIPAERIQGSYFLGTEGAPRLFRVISEALAESGRVGIVRWTKRKGQTLGILRPGPKGSLLISEIAYAAETRLPGAEALAHTFPEAAGTEGEIAQAAALIEKMSLKRVDLDAFADRTWAAEHELVARAAAGELDAYTLPEPEEAQEEVTLLEDLLSGAASA